MTKPIGSKSIDSSGHYMIKVAPNHWIRESRHILGEILGRTLLATEDVHHKDGNPLNNDLSNLYLMDHGKHTVFHWTGKSHSAEAKSNIAKNHFTKHGYTQLRDSMGRFKGVI